MELVNAWRPFVFCALLAGFTVSASEPAQAYKIFGRWTSTKTDGGGLSRGDALTLTWSVVPDGEGWSRDGNSNLIDFLDDGWGVGNRQADLTNRGWWSVMNRVYNQYQRVSGLTMIYEPEQNPDGSDTGKSGDIRIGGQDIDGQAGGVLADNAYPISGGDMRIDTSRNGGISWYYTNTGAFYNLIAHESGHGTGLEHDSSSGRNFVMETPLNTGIFGLQFDDIYAINRMYGDPREKNGGNDTAGTATWLGELISIGGVSEMGLDADNFGVNENDDDWLGIDGNSDEDWFEFTVSRRRSLDINIVPLGPEYSTDAQGNVDYSARADLNWALYDSNGTQIMKVDRNNAGSNERLYDVFLDPGTYTIRVDGEADNMQFYRIRTEAVDLAGLYEYDSESVILSDPFDVGDSGNVNFQRELTGRQVHGYYDSSWTEQNNEGTGAVGINGGQMRLETLADGDGVADVAQADLMRNFGVQLDSEVWTLSFDLSLSGRPSISGAENLFTLALDDNDLSQGDPGEDPRMSLVVGFDGSVSAVRRDGFVMGSGVFDVFDLEVELIFDETEEQKTVDVLLDGQLFLDDANVWFDDLARYFSFDLTTDDGFSQNAISYAFLDDLTIELGAPPELAGDYNSDGVVDAADYAVWRANLGAPAGSLPNDADGGVIGADQYDTWRSNYGATSGAGAGAATSVPEPAALALWSVLGMALCGRRRARA